MAGQYRETVTLYTPAATVSDGIGGRKPAGPEAQLTTWAAVQQLQARSFFEGGQLYTRQPYRIRLRYVNAPDLRTTQRVEWQGIRIGIASVQVDAKRTEITLYGYSE